MDVLRMREALKLNVDHYVSMLLRLYDVREMDVVVVEHAKRIETQLEIELQMMHHMHPIRE
jgi:hypothetical protein